MESVMGRYHQLDSSTSCSTCHSVLIKNLKLFSFRCIIQKLCSRICCMYDCTYMFNIYVGTSYMPICMSFYQILVQPNLIKGSGVVFETQCYFYVVVIRGIVKFIKRKNWRLQLLQCKKPLYSVTVSIFFLMVRFH